MPEQIPINNGGEAPEAAKAPSAVTAAADSSSDVMHQHGGEAPTPSASSGEPQVSRDEPASDSVPPAGGFVRLR
ncbi:hypothetical protein SAMN05414139_09305 [Burkholderia sp. D7]|nr:hypothetical protein SAMN05414139_09305 [Burkholderia sp. D7]